MKAIKRLVLVFIVALAGVAGTNYLMLQSKISVIVDADPRNRGIKVWTHYGYFLDPSILVFDLRDVGRSNSMADVFRVLLQFAEARKDSEYNRIELDFRGRTKFFLKGEYFKTLGEEYGSQNPIYTMRTFSENVFDLDGDAAYPAWTGGWLGVMSKEMEQFNEFHKAWYMSDLSRLP